MERAIRPSRARPREEARSLGRITLTILLEIREVESRVPLRRRAGRRAQAAAAVLAEGRHGAGAVVLELAPDLFGLGQAFAAQAGDVEEVVVCGCGGSGLAGGEGDSLSRRADSSSPSGVTVPSVSVRSSSIMPRPGVKGFWETG